jgi:hypothetical protein
MIILAYILSGLSLLMSALFLVKLKYPSFVLLLKLLAVVLSPYWAIMGAVGAVIGLDISSSLGCSDGDCWCWLDDLVCLAMCTGPQGV